MVEHKQASERVCMRSFQRTADRPNIIAMLAYQMNQYQIVLQGILPTAVAERPESPPFHQIHGSINVTSKGLNDNSHRSVVLKQVGISFQTLRCKSIDH